MEKPKCEKCINENKKYSVTQPQYGITTLMGISSGYWDEDGKYHEPYNPNRTTYTYICSNGHSWTQTY